MKNLQENIVPAAHQNLSNFYPHPGTGIRILFVGNSITKHAPKPDIGWTNDCGMAASELEKDYVHLVMQKVRVLDPNVGFAIAQVAPFERAFETLDIAEQYRGAADYRADIILMFFGANVRKDYLTEEAPAVSFGEKYEQLRNFFCTNPRAKVFHSAGFYIRPKLDAEKRAVAKKYGDAFLELGDICTREDTHGQFNHPSDLGMQELADLFFSAIEPSVRALMQK